MRLILVAPIVVVLLAGCVHSSTVERELPQPPESYATVTQAQQADEVGRFWELFGDAALSRLVQQALADNLTIAQGWARLQQAQASLRAARAGYWPTLSLNGQAGRTRTAVQFGQLGTQTFDRNTLSVSLAASYEIDLWGKVRYAAKAANLELEATKDDLRAAYLSVAAQLVESYYLAAELRAQLRLLQQTVQGRKHNLELVQRRYKEGVVTALDLYQAQQTLATAEASRHQMRDRLASAEHAMAVLAGRAPGKPVSGAMDQLPTAVRSLPPGLPAQLLLRRPDLRAAHRRLMAADARVGQAVAGHYPSITLSASVGYQFDPTALVWNLLGSLLAPIFQGNRISADVDLKQAQLRLAVASYRAALLQALREVEDALSSGREVAHRVEWLERKVKAAEGAMRMSLEQYTQGLVSFLQVLTAEESVYAAKRELISARRELISARVQLARALGGGWMEQQMKRHQADAHKQEQS